MDATCSLCPFNCKIPEKGVGKCRARGNINGKIISLGYGRVTTMIEGPVEQKLYHFHPGMRILSVGYYFCNLRCHWCQNFEISQSLDASSYDLIAPEDVVAHALKRKLPAIAFTYSEPLVNYECVLETAMLARRHGLLTILKTNGYFETEAFSNMVAWMDAVNVDVKGTAELYRDLCGIDLPDDPCEWGILENLRRASGGRCHVEASTLAVHGYCEDDEANETLFASIMAMCGREIPLRILKMIPDYRMRDAPSVPDDRLLKMKESAKKYFSHVYVDNAGMPNVTECSKCGKALVKRNGLDVVENTLMKGKCPGCGHGNNFRA